MIDFLSGAVTLGYLVGAAFFVAFYRKTRDRLFAAFAAAFLLFAVNQALSYALTVVSESADVKCFKLVDGKVTFVHRRLWPALVDDKEQVTLKWQSDASQAGWLHRWASARLIWMRLAVQYRELRQRGEKLPGFQKAVLGSNAKAMLDDALLRIVADHFRLDEPIRDAATFAARLQQHSGDLVPVADKRLKLISDMLGRSEAHV